MAIDDRILLKQSEELFSLRERNINNIGSSANSFFTFLGLVLTALAIFLDDNDPTLINSTQHIVLIIAGIIVFGFGIFTRQNIWSSYTNQIYYTRMLNMTRAYLIYDRSLTNKILLPIRSDEPEFDTKGFLGQKFSKNDIVVVLKWINSFVFAITIYAFLTLISRQELLQKYEILKNISTFPINLFLILFIFYSCMIVHNEYDENIKIKAENEWKRKIQNKSLPFSMLYDKKNYL